MSESLMILLVPLLVLPIVALFAFAGCLPDLAPLRSGYQESVMAEPDLVSYWHLDDRGQGDFTAKDSAPDQPMNGEYRNVPGVTFEQPGMPDPLVAKNKAPEFDGVQGFVEVPFHPLLNPPRSFSVEAWVRPSGISPDPQVVLGSYEVDASGNVVRGFVLDVIPSASSGPSRLRARIGDGSGSSPLEASLGDATQLDGWHHVVVTYDVAVGIRTVALYVNAYEGNPTAELSSSLKTPLLYTANGSAPLRIGAGQGVPPASLPGQFFRGRIDEVALYRRSLSRESVRSHFLAVVAPS